MRWMNSMTTLVRPSKIDAVILGQTTTRQRGLYCAQRWKPFQPEHQNREIVSNRERGSIYISTRRQISTKSVQRKEIS